MCIFNNFKKEETYYMIFLSKLFIKLIRYLAQLSTILIIFLLEKNTLVNFEIFTWILVKIKIIILLTIKEIQKLS